MAGSFSSFFRTYGGLLTTWLLFGVSVWYHYAPSRYVHHPDLVPQLTPALHTLLGAHLLLWLLASLLALALWRLSARRALRLLGLVIFCAACWFTERGLQQPFAHQYYTVWKYQVEERLHYQPLQHAQLLPVVLQDVQNPTEPFRVRDKLVMALGQAGVPAAFPVLQAIAQDPTQHPELRFSCLLVLRRLQPQRLATWLATLPTDGVVTRYRAYMQRYSTVARESFQ